jgi:hypothetical protein
MIPPLFALWPPFRRPVQIGGLRLVELAPDPVICVQHIVHDVLWVVEGGQDFVSGSLRIHHLVVSVTAQVLLAPFLGWQAQGVRPDSAHGQSGGDLGV